MYTVATIWIYQYIIQGCVSLFKTGWHLYNIPVDLDVDASSALCVSVICCI